MKKYDFHELLRKCSREELIQVILKSTPDYAKNLVIAVIFAVKSGDIIEKLKINSAGLEEITKEISSVPAEQRHYENKYYVDLMVKFMEYNEEAEKLLRQLDRIEKLYSR